MKVHKEKVHLELARSCMSLRDLSMLSGVPIATITAVIGGRNARPETLGRIARALGVDVTEIMEDSSTEARR